MWKRNRVRGWAELSIFLLVMGGRGWGRIIYVDTDARGANDGASWAQAYNFLQDALMDANSSGDVNEIRVAQGIYNPDQNSVFPNGTGNRKATFQLVDGVAMRGGYAGVGAPDPNERDVDRYVTILSGDLDGNDVDVNKPGDLKNEPTRAENSYHVVVSMENDETALLDGFGIRGGNAYWGEHWSDWNGGGVYLFKSSVRIVDCIIRGNWAGHGGGICCRGGSPRMSSCTVSGNGAGGWDVRGGGIYCKGGRLEVTSCVITKNAVVDPYAKGGGIHGCGGPITDCFITGNFAEDLAGGLNECSGPIIGCTISKNVAGRDAGGLARCDGPIIDCEISGNVAQEEDTGALGLCGDLINCVIVGNSAGRDAGAMGMGSSNVINCIISGNRAGGNGGALRGFWGVITNCTITGNYAGGQGGAMHDCDAEIHNCIIYGNESGDFSFLSESSGPSYSCVQEDSNGTGCIVADPCFVKRGHWADVNDANVGVEPNDPNARWVEGDYHLLAYSPCIDVGDNKSVPADTYDLDADGNTGEPVPFDLEGNARIVDGDGEGKAVVDMGAYEFFVPPMEVGMRLTPRALNTGSQGRWVKAHLVLLEGYALEDVDVNRAAVLEPGGVESEYMNVFVNEDGLVEIEAAFGRAELCSMVTGDEGIEVRVVGFLRNGQSFYGTHTVKVTSNMLKYLANLASYWLEAECGERDWCAGLDLDQDSVVNFVDFGLFDGCCIGVIGD